MKKRLILITIDCLRRDRLKVYGHSKNIAPHLNKLSEGAFIFKNAVTNGPNTPPSFYAMFTSEFPLLYNNYVPLPPYKKKISEILQKNGITTCGIHSNAHLGKIFNYHLGFDEFIDVVAEPQFSLRRKLSNSFYSFLNLFGIKKRVINKIKASIIKILNFEYMVNTSYRANKTNSPYSNAKTIITHAINWLENNYESNFFLWIHMMDVHGPYYPPKEYIQKISNENTLKSYYQYFERINNFYRPVPESYEKKDDMLCDIITTLYNAEILYCDHYLGILFQYLKNRDIYDGTTIIITSDHGEELFERNYLGHSASLYDEILRIPFIFKLDNSLNEQKIINEQVQLIDLAPTILDLLNLPKEQDFMGLSLIPLINGEINYKHTKYALSASLQNNKRNYNGLIKRINDFYLFISVRTLNWKLIYSDQEKKVQFFNLKEDPDELVDLSESSNEVVLQSKKKLFEKIEPFLKRYNSEDEKIKRAIDKNALKYLIKKQ
ncbi:MAG: sulfatase [Promethearchaeota archaeon]